MLSGNKVFLRRLEEADLSRTIEWINQTEIFVTMGVFGPRSQLEQTRWFERVHDSRTNVIFAICLTKDKQHVGNASLFDIDYRNSNAGLTIMFPALEHRGKGYGTEALRLLCNYAFDYLNLHKLYCKTDNTVASKLYTTLGFVQEGVLRQQAYHYGQYIDKVCYGLLRDEFRACLSEKGSAREHD